MYYWLIPLCIVGGLTILTLLTSAVCFFKVFYAFRQKRREEYPIPPGKEYEPYREQMIQWIKQTRAMLHTVHYITSYDGKRLRAKFFEYEKGAPIEILFHGYKGEAERDLSGGVSRCHSLGHSALIVDQRAAGGSEGRVITFGAKESRDCISWVDYTIKSIDSNAKIILTGISMGASTVMMASAETLPENVIGVLADCGYTSTGAIIKKVIKDMGLPPKLLYPFVRLGALLFGGFDPDGNSPLSAMKKCSLPVIFFHGEADGFVPADMSRENYEACASAKKRLVLIKGADHGLAFPKDQELYLGELREFFPAEERAHLQSDCILQ